MPPGVQGPLTVIKVVRRRHHLVDNGGRMKIRLIGLDTPDVGRSTKPGAVLSA